MCAILDANAVHEVFGFNRTPAGDQFRRWVDSGQGQLVVGGSRLKEELYRNRHFNEWLSEAERSPRVRFVNDESINTKAAELEDAGVCESDDEHVIALAQKSHARLLYSHDEELHTDFGNRQLINPRGAIYQEVSHAHLLRNKNLCRAK